MTALSQNAVKVLQSRYLKRDEQGSGIETPDEMFQRVAKAIAAAELMWGTSTDVEKWADIFFQAMRQLLFLPNSPTLMNAGTSSNQLSACFVLPVDDNLKSIFSTLKHAALIQQSGGGTGFNFSHIRPKDDRINGLGGLAAGPVAFMKIFDTATEHVKQGGRRRGANMGILSIDHPDIEEFITSKRQEGTLRNFNISVGITDEFMHAVQHNANWQLLHPGTRIPVKTLRARLLWNLLVEQAWQCGDPGLVFLDTMNGQNPTPALGKIEATNPCGEVPLLPYESCNLGSVNLSKFVNRTSSKNNRRTLAESFDLENLAQIIRMGIRFLDNVIESNSYLIPKIRDMAVGNRKIGLGVMGWAEALSILELPYESNRAVTLADGLMKFISEKSLEASVELAEERGVFKNWEKSMYYPHVKIRNATRTSIAPTGSISIIADTSPSIEPFIALAFQRHHVLQDDVLTEVNKNFIRCLNKHSLYSAEIIKDVTITGTAASLPLPSQIKKIFKTALEIESLWHLKHQLAFQKYTDNAVSKTINLPETSSIEEVDSIFQTAWKLKAKGITVFRNNARRHQVIRQGVRSDVRGCKVCIE